MSPLYESVVVRGCLTCLESASSSAIGMNRFHVYLEGVSRDH